MRNILSFHKKIEWRPGSNTVAYYPLEKDGNDYSGNGHNLTWNSTPTYTTSGTKQVAYLGGNKVGVIANLSGTYTNYTFNVWCKPTNTNTWQEIFDNLVYSGNTNNVYLNFNGTGKELAGYSGFAYQYRPNGGSNTYQNIYETNNRGVSTWYNLAVTSTASGIKVYVNGTQVASNSTTGTIVLSSGNNSIGARYNSGQGNVNYFSGYLSEFIMEDKTWTAEEVLDYYNQTKSAYIEEGWGPGENTVAYYPLKENVLDYSGNGNDGTGAPNSFTDGVANYSGNSTTLPYSIIDRSIYTVNVRVNPTGTSRMFLAQHTQVSYGFNLQAGNNALRRFVVGPNQNVSSGVNSDGNLSGRHLMTAVSDGTTIHLYIDGVKQSATNNYTGNNGATLYMGYDHGYNGGAFSGKISELIVEDKVRTAQEIQDYYNRSKSNYGL